jgi:hypothetical protein
MSFDLLFCSASPRPQPRQLSDLFDGIPGVEVRKRRKGLEAHYSNEDTGVYALFEYGIPSESPETPPLPEGYEDTGLSFSLNYVRPTFFALETIPIVEEVAQRGDLVVLNPQDDEPPREWADEELIQSWDANNRRAVQALMRSDPSLSESIYYMPREVADRWWRFMLARDRIWSDVLSGADIFIPGIFLLPPDHGRTVRRVITWTEAIPMVFPDCDSVILGKGTSFGRDGLPKSLNVRTIDAGIVRDALADRLVPLSDEFADAQLLSIEAAASMRPSFEALFESAEDFQREQVLSSDQIVDVDLDNP